MKLNTETLVRMASLSASTNGGWSRTKASSTWRAIRSSPGKLHQAHQLLALMVSSVSYSPATTGSSYEVRGVLARPMMLLDNGSSKVQNGRGSSGGCYSSFQALSFACLTTTCLNRFKLREGETKYATDLQHGFNNSITRSAGVKRIWRAP